MRAVRKTLIALLVGLVAGCETPPPVAISDLARLPAEQALLAGIRAYEEGQYPTAELELQRALNLKLRAPRDTATAHKYLAFIYCTTVRVPECAGAFSAARSADPKFELNKTEAGHPQWGAVYRQALGLPSS